MQPIKDFVALVEKHWDGIITWHTNHLNNGLLEGTSSLIQAAKARARGYRNKTNDDHHRLPHRSPPPATHHHPSDTRLHDLTLSNPLKTAKSR
ncbi:MAG: transposase [Pseudonocardiales bacterium]|nr:transposase [Pseudonocardiales bacterium]MBV9031208.1 transposase [Pseudonocardiales bacterium]